MALPVAGGDGYPPLPRPGGPYYPAKRRSADAVDDDHHHHHHQHDFHAVRHKRPKYAGPVAFRAAGEESPAADYPPLHHPHPHSYHRYPSPLPHLPSPELAAAPPAMERTASGHSILPDPTERCASTELLEDHEAAQRVRDHLAAFRRRNPDSKHERILRSIINPRPPRGSRPRRRHHRQPPHYHHHHRHHHHYHQPSPRRAHLPGRPEGDEEKPEDQARDDVDDHHHHHHHHHHEADDEEDEAEENYPLDNAALESIFSAANEIFFNGRLSQRVAWDWSHASAGRFAGRVIGTTALRRAAAHTRGFETLVVLSSPILRDPRYSRRLLISTFLHELIHCYLFICCGFRARGCGGHTPGFRAIAAVMDEWVGDGGGGLYLTRVEADLELFRVGRGRRRERGRESRERGRESGEGGDAAEEEGARRFGHGHGHGHGHGRSHGGGGGMGVARAKGPHAAVYPCSGMAVEQDEYAPITGPTSQALHEVVYFRGSGAAPGGAGAGPEPVCYGPGPSVPPPGPCPATPTQEVVHYHGYRPAATGAAGSGSGSGSSHAWVRHRRSVRPLYVVYSAEEPAPTYVYPGQRP